MGLFNYEKFTIYLLVFSLANAPMFRLSGSFFGSLWGDIQKAGVDVGCFSSCVISGFSSSDPGCKEVFSSSNPEGAAGCTDPAAPCTGDVLYNELGTFTQGAAIDLPKCKASINALSNRNTACEAAMKSLPIQSNINTLLAWMQPLVDVTCLTAQLNSAGQDSSMILPGCDPTTAACKGNSLRYDSTNLYAQYIAGYLFNHPGELAYNPTTNNPEEIFSITDFIIDWITFQQNAEAGEDMQGNVIAAQINVLDPFAFLGSANNIAAIANTDLNKALQHNIQLLTDNPNNAFPNPQSAPATPTCPSLSYPPCCNAPSMSLADAQANIMTMLNKEMLAILSTETNTIAMVDYFQTNTFAKILDATTIPPLPIIDLANIMLASTGPSTFINNQPVPVLVGKVVTNWPGLDFITAGRSEYLGHLLLTQSINLTGSYNGQSYNCDPDSILADYRQTTSLCDLAVKDITNFAALTASVITMILFMGVFKVLEVGAAGLSSSGNVAVSAMGDITGKLVAFYGKALMVPMLLMLSPGGKAWFNGLPSGVQDVWQPPLHIDFTSNLTAVQTELVCELKQYLSVVQAVACSSSTPCATGYTCTNNICILNC